MQVPVFRSSVGPICTKGPKDCDRVESFRPGKIVGATVRDSFAGVGALCLDTLSTVPNPAHLRTLCRLHEVMMAWVLQSGNAGTYHVRRRR